MPRQRGPGRVRDSGRPVAPPEVAERRAPRGGALLAGLEAAREEAAAMTPDEVAGVPRAPLSAFAPHPDNPKHRHDSAAELKELAKDIEQGGLLQPVIVASRDRVVADDPRLDEVLPRDARWVLLAGHRRWGASRLATGVVDLPYLVRNDLADRRSIRRIFLRENIHRQSITVIEEARGYQTMIDEEGLSQREVAAEVGVSQSRVSKTLQLLQLPARVQKAVEAGEVSANAARRLLELPDDRREPVFVACMDDLPEDDNNSTERVAAAIATAVRRELAAQERAKAVVKARRRLRQDKIAEIDPKAQWGTDYRKHQLDPDEVDSERAADGIAGAVIDDDGTVRYFARDLAPRHRHSQPPVKRRSRQRARGDSIGITPSTTVAVGDSNGITRDGDIEPAAGPAAAAARAARTAAVRQLLDGSTRLEVRVAMEILTDYALTSGQLDWRAGAAFAGEILGDHAAVDEALTGQRGDAQRAALAVALGALEAEAGDPRYADRGHTWPTAVRRHVQRLADLGYHTLTDYDRDRLTG